MIKAKFSIFQVQIERVFGYGVKFCKTALCIAPERLNAIDMPFSIRKLILAMVHLKVLIKPNIDQVIVTSPTIRVSHRVRLDMAADNTLQSGFGTILVIDLVPTFQESEHHRLAISTASTFTSNMLRYKVRFVDF